MNKQIFFVISGMIFIFSAHAYCFQQNNVISAGDQFPEITSEYKLSKNDRDYLGLGTGFLSFFEKKTFSLQDIEADIILVEFFNKYCTSCQAQAPFMNELYQEIIKNAALKDHVKFIGIGAGNNVREVESFRREKTVPFPMIPDHRFTAYDAIGDPGATPFTIILKKSGSDLLVSSTHVGLTKDISIFVSAILTALKKKGPQSSEIDLHEKHRADTDRRFSLMLSEKEKQEFVHQSLRAAGLPDGSIKKIAKLMLHSGELYQITFQTNQGTQIYYSQIISRKPVCDVCHGIHFIITFDAGGTIKDFMPLHVTKLGNQLLTDRETALIRNKLINHSISRGYNFNPEVDAVSTATMSSALIYNSVDKLQSILAEISKTD